MTKSYQSELKKEYLKLPFEDFIRNYDSELIKLIDHDYLLGIIEQPDEERFQVEFIKSNEYEIEILKNALDYINKSHRVIKQFVEHRAKQGRNSSIDYFILLNSNRKKIFFVSKKLEKLGCFVDLKKILLDKDYGSKNISSNLINGKRPNISERYEIANDVFNIYKTISELTKLNYTEKHILLAHLMGCSQQTARELFNGTQVKRTPIREDLVNSYLDSLK
jgi:hypothetical protein